MFRRIIATMVTLILLLASLGTVDASSETLSETGGIPRLPIALEGYAYVEQFTKVGDVTLVIDEAVISGKSLSGRGTLFYQDTKYLLTFDGLNNHAGPRYFAGWGTARPEGLNEERGPGGDVLGISIHRGFGVVTGVFRDAEGRSTSFAVGPRVLSLDKLKAQYVRNDAPISALAYISEGDGDLFVRGGGYNSYLRMEVAGVPSLSQGDPSQEMATRIWTVAGSCSTGFLRVYNVYTYTNVPRDSTGWGFSWSQINPPSSSSSTTISVSVAYQALSVSISWGSSSTSTSYTSTQASFYSRPSSLYCDDMVYSSRSSNNGLAFEPYLVYRSGSPEKKYYGTVSGQIEYYEESLGYFFTVSLAASETQWALTYLN